MNKAELYVVAHEAASSMEDSIESNVVQKRVVALCVTAALNVVWPYVVTDEDDQPPTGFFARLRYAFSSPRKETQWHTPKTPLLTVRNLE